MCFCSNEHLKGQDERECVLQAEIKKKINIFRFLQILVRTGTIGSRELVFLVWVFS